MTEIQPNHQVSTKRVLTGMIAGLMTLFVLVSGYSYWIVDSVRSQSEKENLAAVKAQASLGVLFISDHQRNLLHRLSALASRNSFKKAMKNLDAAELGNYLQPLIEHNQEIVRALWLGLKGKVLHAVPGLEGRQGLAGVSRDGMFLIKGYASVSPVHRTAQGPMVAVNVRVVGPKGATLGFLAVLQRPDLWKKYFSHLAARPGRRFFIYDQKGGLVARGPEPWDARGDAAGLLATMMRREVRAQSREVTRLADLPGMDRRAFVSAAPVGDFGWVLAVVQDYAPAMAPYQVLSRSLWAFLLVLVVFMVMLGFLLASRYRMQQEMLIKTDEEARHLEEVVWVRTRDLDASNRRYRDLLADLPDMVYQVDGQGVVTFAGGASSNVLGYEPHEMEGRSFRDFVHPDDRDLFDQQRAEAKEGRDMSILALRHIAKDGRVRWLSIHSRGIRDPEGHLVGRRGVARDVTQRIMDEKRIHELSGKLINAQEEERKRLALDLHDELGQLLSALKIGMQSLAEEVPEEEKRELVRLIRLSQTIMDRVRALAYNLRPSILDNFGLVAAVQDLCDSLAEAGLVNVECHLGPIDENLPPETSLSLFRCVQEALNNVVKHSHSLWAEVDMELRDGVIYLEVRDQGVGFDPEQSGGAQKGGRRLGLLGMAERLRLLGGGLEIKSSKQGTILRARVPLGAK